MEAFRGARSGQAAEKLSAFESFGEEPEIGDSDARFDDSYVER